MVKPCCENFSSDLLKSWRFQEISKNLTFFLVRNVTYRKNQERVDTFGPLPPSLKLIFGNLSSEVAVVNLLENKRFYWRSRRSTSERSVTAILTFGRFLIYQSTVWSIQVFHRANQLFLCIIKKHLHIF